MDKINFTGQFLVAMPALDASIFAGSLVYVCEHNAAGALGVIVNRPLGFSLKDIFEQIYLPKPIAHLATEPMLFGGPFRHEQGFILHRPLGFWQSTVTVTEEIGLTRSSDVLSAFADFPVEIPADPTDPVASVAPEVADTTLATETSAEISAETTSETTESTLSVRSPAEIAVPRPNASNTPHPNIAPSGESFYANAHGLSADQQFFSDGQQSLLLLLGYVSWSAGQLEHEMTDNYWLSVDADPSILFDVAAGSRLDAVISRLGIKRSQLSSVFGHA